MLETILPQGTFLSENPLLSIAIVAAVAATVFLIVAAVVTSFRPRNGYGTQPKSDPALEAVVEALDVDSDGPAGTEPNVTAEVPAPDMTQIESDDRQALSEPVVPTRRGFGYGALGLAFVIGAALGFTAFVVIPKNDLRAAVSSLAGLLDEEPAPAASDAPVEPPPSIKQETERLPSLSETQIAPDPPAPQPAEMAEISARLTTFADGIKGTLPRDAGPDIVLTSVETEGMAIQLGYTVLRQMTTETVAEFDAFIMKTVKSLFCGDGAQELRFLNDNGVSFHMNYTGPQGDPVTSLTVQPNFCA